LAWRSRGGVGARVLAELGVEAHRLRPLLGGSRPDATPSARVGVDEAARLATLLIELDGDWSGVRPAVRSFLRLGPRAW
jgi:hypothetical protein